MANALDPLNSREMLDELLNSDTAYFGAAAQIERVEGFQISHLPGLEALPAACVVHPPETRPGAGWSQALMKVEDRLCELGCSHSRFYQLTPDTALELRLQENGYRASVEIALLNDYQGHGFRDHIENVCLLPVRSSHDWEKKLALHRQMPRGPDGHPLHAESWVEMERCKCEAGYMTPFLIYCCDIACGAVNFAARPNIGRLKNLVVHPDWRRKRIGEEAARLIAVMAQEAGKVAAGSFAVKDGSAVNMYIKAGYAPATRQTEWFKTLS